MHKKPEQKKKNLIITIAVFSAMWIAYYALELFSGRIKGSYSIIVTFIVPVMFLASMALIFYGMSQKKLYGLKKKTVVFSIVILIALEQLLKHLIRNHFDMSAEIEIIKDWLYIIPSLNTLGSWGAARFGLEFGMKTFIIMNIIAVPLFIQLYRFYIVEKEKSFWVDLCFVLGFSGVVCSLIDKVFFGGSLDFIAIDNLFIADIKDFYITLSIGCLLVEMFVNSDINAKTTLKDDFMVIKKFVLFNLKK
jgi:signal peptidase II